MLVDLRDANGCEEQEDGCCGACHLAVCASLSGVAFICLCLFEYKHSVADGKERVQIGGFRRWCVISSCACEYDGKQVSGWSTVLDAAAVIRVASSRNI